MEGKPVKMELDTGAPVLLMSWSKFNSIFPGHGLEPCDLLNVPMQTYLGEPIRVKGQAQVEVCYEQQQVKLPLVVVEGDDPSIFGCQWLDWNSINSVRNESLKGMLDRHAEVFKSELGTLKGYEAKNLGGFGAQPRFHNARPVLYAMKSEVEAALDRLQKDGIIEPIQFADWAASIVAVLKSDGKSLRICGDFKVTINQALKLDRYPIGTPFQKLKIFWHSLIAGGKAFTKLGMSQAYQQLLLEEDSKRFVVINTHRGLFRYNRLPLESLRPQGYSSVL